MMNTLLLFNHNDCMNSFFSRKVGYVITGSALVGMLAFGAIASAQTAAPTQGSYGHGGMWGGAQGGKAPGVFGTVSAVNGTTLTVVSKGFGQNATVATYSVNASNATVTKA